jgi:hypothetical protein
MRRITDTIGAIIIVAIVVNLLVAMIAPYAPFLLLGAVLVLGGAMVSKYLRRY